MRTSAAVFNIGEGQPNVHDKIVPADVYSADRITAQIRLSGSDAPFSAERNVWRLSPLGVEVDVSSLQDRPSVGSKVDLRLKIRGETYEYKAVPVGSRINQNNAELLGVRLSTSLSGATPASLSNDPSRRRKERWICNRESMPTGIAANPIRFNDFVHFRVEDISAEGMLIYTSLRNRFLVPGMTLDATVSFPLCAQVNVKLRLLHARIVRSNGKDMLAVGVTIKGADPRVLDTIAQYVFQFGPPGSIDSLRRDGLKVPHAAKGVEFSSVRTEEEFLEVLQLRKAAYVAAGKYPADISLDKVGDIYDSRARIIIAKHHGRIVASVRLIFHDPEDSYELEKHVRLPVDFPRKDESVEVSRLCVSPDYRGSDVFYYMLKHSILLIAQAKRRWLVSFASEEMVQIYCDLGAKLTGTSFEHKGLQNRVHHVLLWDIASALSGKGVNPFFWNLIYADITGYIKDQDILDFDPMMNMRMGFYRAMSPLTPLVRKFVFRKRRKK